MISRIREAGNGIIISHLKENGYSEFSPSHGDILVVLYRNDRITMKEISEKIHRTKATVTVLVDKLEKIGLVRREKSSYDSRNTYILLTDKGLLLEPLFNKISDELNSALYKNFSDDEAKTLDLLLEKMANNI